MNSSFKGNNRSMLLFSPVRPTFLSLLMAFYGF